MTMGEHTPETLREPRAGIHENGEEEMKSWDTLYAQCLWAADRIEALERVRRAYLRCVGAMGEELDDARNELDAALREAEE